MKVALITGTAPHYEIGLISGLVECGVNLEVIGGDNLSGSAMVHHPTVSFHNLHGSTSPAAPLLRKCLHVASVYWKLMAFAARTNCPLIHIQWPYKFPLFDRTLLACWYKVLGKKLVFTAHNIDAGARDGCQSWSNRVSLRFFYRFVDHTIVHTERMRGQLVEDFGVAVSNISVIPHGIMSAVPESDLTRSEARRRLNLVKGARVLLFFGSILPYKGLDLLIEAMQRLVQQDPKILLLIAGDFKKHFDYWARISQAIDRLGLGKHIITDLRHIPDDEIEIYFKAADVLVMPYRSIFQSGVLFLAYRFGLPVVATDVGSLREAIISGETGYICQPDDPEDMARVIHHYFGSELFSNLEHHRPKICRDASTLYSWSTIGKSTVQVYQNLLER